jgi:hypothetical protein
MDGYIPSFPDSACGFIFNTTSRRPFFRLKMHMEPSESFFYDRLELRKQKLFGRSSL